MWLLSCEGDLLEGKRLWLRPGTTHLLGRTTGASENGERVQHIAHKQVSRKHLTLAVADSSAADVSRLHVKSEIRLNDNSRSGTTIDGEKIKQEERVLQGSAEKRAEHTIRLGSYEHPFRLVWQPVVVAFTSAGKKSRELALEDQQAKFRGTDVKVFTDYLVNVTTHCVSKKRNTPATLQALLQAKWLVTDEYLSLLAKALQRDSNNLGSALETDFDSHWPKEENYIIPAGTEPNPRPNELFKPNPDRAEVFHDFTFVFLSQSQLDTLFPVITAGGGKALARDVDPTVDRVEDVVAYIREVAGHKQSKNFRLSQQPTKGGVVVVRANERDEPYRVFMRSINIALDQRSIEQNELLDPIVTLDTSGLRKQLAEESQGSAAESQSRQQRQVPTPEQDSARVPRASQTSNEVRDDRRNSTSAANPPAQTRTAEDGPPPTNSERESAQPQSQPSATEEMTAPKKRSRRIITQSRFKGFDDFDPSQFSKPAPQSPEPSFDDPQHSQAQSVQDMDVDETSQTRQTQLSSRKRPAPPRNEADDEAAMYAAVLPATHAMKKRKIALEKNVDAAPIQTETERRLAEKAARAKKKAKELDVMAEIQARRKREEEDYQRNEESLREALDGVDIKDLKDLVKVEEMDVPVRERPVRPATGLPSDRWNPAWNGRSNFKKFRRQGERVGNGPRLQRVLVTLEEVPRKGHGIGEEYWLTSTSMKKSKGKSQSQSQSQASRHTHQSTTTFVDEDNTDSARFRRRIQASREEDRETEDYGDMLVDEIARRTRDEQAFTGSTPSQTLGTESQRRAAGKRRAEEQAGPAAAKKARPGRQVASMRDAVMIDDDDDDDGLKFRRRRK